MLTLVKLHLTMLCCKMTRGTFTQLGALALDTKIWSATQLMQGLTHGVHMISIRLVCLLISLIHHHHSRYMKISEIKHMNLNKITSLTTVIDMVSIHKLLRQMQAFKNGGRSVLQATCQMELTLLRLSRQMTTQSWNSIPPRENDIYSAIVSECFSDWTHADIQYSNIEYCIRVNRRI
jgi:hypothetical protein